MLPLDGLTVVTLEHAIAAPLATRHLADQGARVIKIERPGTGDFARGYDARARGLSSHFMWTNRSKESLTLDLKHPQASDILGGLLAKADVLVQNLAPGAAARLGLSHATLKPSHPGLIVCNISGYGADGPERDRKAYDLLIQAEAGLLSITGTPETPSKAGISIADIAAGMYGYSTILAALIERGRTGIGREIDISMLEACAEWMGYPMYYASDGAPPPARTGASHPTIYPYGPFPTGDGQEIMLGLQNEREWDRFCTEVLQRPTLRADRRFMTNADRVAHKAALRSEIVSVFSALNAQQIMQRLQAAGIATAQVNDMAALWAHPQLAARDRWRDVQTPAGPQPALLPPGMSDAQMGPIPELGAHTRSILQELGFAPAQIDALAQSGAI